MASCAALSTMVFRFLDGDVVGDFSTEGLVAHQQNLELLDIVDKEFAEDPAWSSMCLVF
jgi:hypothetical protein